MIFIVPCGSIENINSLKNKLKPHDTIVYGENCTENLYEYPGLLFVTQIAKLISDDDVILYCHSKGTGNMAPHQTGNFKFNLEVLLKKSNLKLFDDDKTDVLGVFPSVQGWIWYNFFIVTTSFIRNIYLEKNLVNRYYYERWLGLNNAKSKSLYGLSSCEQLIQDLELKETFTAEELNANIELQNIYKKLGY